MAAHYVTFGATHNHYIHSKQIHADVVVKYEAENKEEGRALAFEMFGSKFSFEYSVDQWRDSYLMHYVDGYVEIDVEQFRENLKTAGIHDTH